MNLKEFLGLGFYTSELDRFLAEFDKNHPKLSASQRKEINKYARLNRLRDNEAASTDEKSFWDKF